MIQHPLSPSHPTGFGPWAVVTGASSGIGAGFARALAARDHDLVLVARREDLLDTLAARLSTEHDVQVRTVVADLAEPAGLTSVLTATDELDVGLLVSNAGTGRPGAFVDADLDELQRRHRLNTTAHLVLVQAFARRFVARGGGNIELVGALGATNGIPHMAHDAGSKSYVASLAAGLHRELKPHGIRVSVMLPGNIDTPVIPALGMSIDDLPMSPYPVDKAVASALRALERGRATHVPDPRMRWGNRLAPKRLLVSVNARLLGRAAQQLDAERPLEEVAS